MPRKASATTANSTENSGAPARSIKLGVTVCDRALWLGLMAVLVLGAPQSMAETTTEAIEEAQPSPSDTATATKPKPFELEPFVSFGTAVIFQQFRGDISTDFGLSGGRENPLTAPFLTFGGGVSTSPIDLVPGAPRLVIDGWYGIPVNKESTIQLDSGVERFGADRFTLGRDAAVEFNFAAAASAGLDFPLPDLGEGLQIRPALEYRFLQFQYLGRAERVMQGVDGLPLPGGTIFEIDERVSQHYLGPSVRFDGRWTRHGITVGLFLKVSALFSLNTEEIQQTLTDGTDSATFSFTSRDRAFEFASGISAHW